MAHETPVSSKSKAGRQSRSTLVAIAVVVCAIGGLSVVWLWGNRGWELGSIGLLAWIGVVAATFSVFHFTSSPKQRNRWMYASAAVPTLIILVVIRREQPTTVPSLGFLLLWAVFFFALGLLVMGNQDPDKLTNQVGLAVVTGLVLALAAFVINLVLEDAFKSRDLERRQAETKVAINNREPLIFRNEDLSDFVLTGMSITTPAGQQEFDFSFANMSRVNLENADLRRAILNRTLLDDAKMSWANLAGADLSRAELRRAMLHGANLSGARLDDALLLEAELNGADLSGASLVRVDLTGAHLDPIAEGAGIETAGQRTLLIQADLTNAILANADVTAADLTEAILEQTDFTGATLTDVIVTAPQLEDAILDTETTCPTGDKAEVPDGQREASCEGKTLATSARTPDISFLIDATLPIGSPVGRVASVASGTEIPGYELISVSVDDQKCCDGEDAAGWPFAVDPHDGMVRANSALVAGSAYTLVVRSGVLGNGTSGDVSGAAVACPLGGSQQLCDVEVEVFVRAGPESPAPGKLEFVVYSDADIGTIVGGLSLEDPNMAVVTTGADAFKVVPNEAADEGEKALANTLLIVDGVLEPSTVYDVVVEPGTPKQSPVRMSVSVLTPNRPPQIVDASDAVVSVASEVGTDVVTIAAQDPDPDNMLTFSIRSIRGRPGTCEIARPFAMMDSAEYPFAIDSERGGISVSRPLSERPACYRIEVEVRDDAEVSLSRRVELDVSAVDE